MSRRSQLNKIYFYLNEQFVDTSTGTLYLNTHFYDELLKEFDVQPENDFRYFHNDGEMNIIDLNVGKHVWVFRASNGRVIRSGDVYDKTTS